MRDYKIDLLRFIGLSMIILAHVGPPPLLQQLRNFDVPLMVLVSAMSFGLAFNARESYVQYVWKRVKRLVFPVWIFLTGYFIALFIFNSDSPDLGKRKIFESYALLGGIGYVWIIRVFIIVALLAPFLYQWYKGKKSDTTFLLVILLGFAAYELLLYFARPYIFGGRKEIIAGVVMYAIPYSLLFLLGLRMPEVSRSQNLVLAAVAGVCCFAVAALLWIQSGELVPTQNFKYPPSVYYLSYAIMISALLWLYSDALWAGIGRLAPLRELILFMAQNSIWIYLWHIPFVETINASPALLEVNFALKYLVVFALATAIAAVQVLLVRNVLVPRVGSERAKKNLKLLLTG